MTKIETTPDFIRARYEEAYENARAELAAERELRSLENEVSHEQLREISDLKAELAAERERALHQTSIACRAIEELATEREHVAKLREALERAQSAFYTYEDEAEWLAIQAVLDETKGGGHE